MKFDHTVMAFAWGRALQVSEESEQGGNQSFGQDVDVGPAKSVETDWRDMIDDPKLRDHASRFTSPADLTRAHLELRGKLSKAILRPGRNASANEIAAFRRALGVPESPSYYQFDVVGTDPESGDIAFQSAAAEAFHHANLTVEQGRQLTAWWTGLQADLLERQAMMDRAYAEQSRADLEADWGRETDIKLIHANRAAEMLFGDNLDAIRTLETRDGRYVLDHPHLLRALARLGHEMAEGDLGGTVGADERDTLAEQRDRAREKRNAALQAGSHAEARKWDQREREIIEKMGK